MMGLRSILVFASILLPSVPGQAISGAGSSGEASKGCSINNGTITVPLNTTVADDTWWYLCSGSSWLARGCVVNGQRYGVGEEFFGYLNEFYGRCEEIDGKYIRATVLGCIDVNNHTVEPGNTYIADPLFWANCTSSQQVVSAIDLGNVTLDIIGRRIIGCNDGTEEIIPDDSTFVQVSDDGPLLAGLLLTGQRYLTYANALYTNPSIVENSAKFKICVGLICKIRGLFPQVQPQVCVVANNSETDEAYIGLADHCFGRLRRFVFYCTIAGEEDPVNGTAVYGWEIGWNVSSREFISDLKNSGFRDCINEPREKPRTDKLAPVIFSRRKRDTDKLALDLVEEEGRISAARLKRSAQSDALPEVVASSKFISLRRRKNVAVVY